MLDRDPFAGYRNLPDPVEPTTASRKTLIEAIDALERAVSECEVAGAEPPMGYDWCNLKATLEDWREDPEAARRQNESMRLAIMRRLGHG